MIKDLIDFSCPRCSCRVQDSTVQCSKCGLTYNNSRMPGAKLDELQFVWDFSTPPLDSDITLKIENSAKYLNKCFPQVRAYFLFGKGTRQVSICELGFDCLNSLSSPFAALFVLDRKKRRVHLTLDYELEARVNEIAIKRILKAGYSSLQKHDYVGGTQKMLKQLSNELYRAHKKLPTPERTGNELIKKS